MTPKQDAAVADHTTPDSSVTGDCNGDLPVMFVLDENGAKAEPDWSCYVDGDAGFLAIDDASDDGAADTNADDASDADVADADDGSTDGGSDADASDGGQEPDAADAAAAARIFELHDFVNHNSVPGADIDFFYARSAAGQVDFHATTDDAGQFTFLPPQGATLLAYRVNTRPDSTPTKSLITSIQYDNVIPKAGGTLQGNSLTTGEEALILSGVLGSQSMAKDSAILVAGARDCKARELGGAVITLIDGETNQPYPLGKQQGQTRADYLLASFPNETCTFTSATQAVWAALNVPTNMPGATHQYIVRFSGRKDASQTAPVVMGEVAVELWKNTATIARPYRLSPP